MNNCREVEIDLKIQQVMGPHHAPAAERQIRVWFSGGRRSCFFWKPRTFSNSPWWGESTGAARISFRAPVDREMKIRVSSCTEGLKIRVFLILGILEWNLHWKMRLLSRIPVVYSSKIFDERIAGKLQFKVSARTRKPENQKTRKPETRTRRTRSEICRSILGQQILTFSGNFCTNELALETTLHP